MDTPVVLLGMEDGRYAELGAEVLEIGRDGGERLGGAAEQDGTFFWKGMSPGVARR